MDSVFRGRLRESRQLVFLCSGNVVRSAFAELYARHLGFPVAVTSMATTYRNPALFAPTMRALLVRGVPAELLAAFRPSHLEDRAASIVPGALALGMTRTHLAALARAAPSVGGELVARCLGEEHEVADPVEEGADFESTFEYLARCVRALRGAFPSDAGPGG